jgi:hypothetical protein
MEDVLMDAKSHIEKMERNTSLGNRSVLMLVVMMMMMKKKKTIMMMKTMMILSGDCVQQGNGLAADCNRRNLHESRELYHFVAPSSHRAQRDLRRPFGDGYKADEA